MCVTYETSCGQHNLANFLGGRSRDNTRYLRGHSAHSAHLWLQAYPEHASEGLVTFCLFSHILQVPLFVIT